jgi:hypothetical protein
VEVSLCAVRGKISRERHATTRGPSHDDGDRRTKYRLNAIAIAEECALRISSVPWERDKRQCNYLSINFINKQEGVLRYYAPIYSHALMDELNNQ